MVVPRALVDKLLEKYGMENCKPNTVPLKPGKPTEEQGKEGDKKLYQEIIGSLIYLAYGTRPDIAYAVTALARHMANPQEQHVTLAKGVLRYLKGTRDLGILYDGR